MHFLYLIAGLIMFCIFFVCTIIVIIEAFKDSIWKGLLFILSLFLCWIYTFWFTLVEFKHDNKWGIALGSLGGGIASGLLFRWAGWLP